MNELSNYQTRVLEIKQNGKLKYNDILFFYFNSPSHKWSKLVDFLPDTLLITGLFLLVRYLQTNLFLEVVSVGVIYLVIKLLLAIYFSFRIYRFFKEQGIMLISYNNFSMSLSKFSNFFFSPRNQKDIFEPIIADWQEEYFEALFKKEIWKARWINVRYTYAFIMAMWQKSPLGDLLEYVRKFAS